MTTTDTTTTTLDDHYDVVVVGARAAGAATAMLLARAGFRVAAIDKSTYGSDTLSTHAIARTGVLLLSQWGVLDAIRAADTPRANTMLFHYGDSDVAIDIRGRGDVDGLYSPRRTVLDRSIVDAAVASFSHANIRADSSGFPVFMNATLISRSGSAQPRTLVKPRWPNALAVRGP